MTILWETLGFAARCGFVFITFALSVLVIVRATRSRREERAAGHLEVQRVNEHFEASARTLREASLDPHEVKRARKERRRAQKERRTRERKTYVIDFKGDLMASAVDSLREEVSAILEVAGPSDGVVLRLESPGGAAHSYGLAASQLARLRERKIHLTVCVDRVAASGGYMMACVADDLVAAPFAVVGSIGVAAPIPNAHRLLQRHGVDFETATSGRFKRTVTLFGENTEDGRQKFQEQLDETHELFKSFVKRYRPSLDIELVSTGEHWHALRGHELGLVDRLATSDEVLLEKARDADLLELQFRRRRTFRERIGVGVRGLIEEAIVSAVGRLTTPLA